MGFGFYRSEILKETWFTEGDHRYLKSFQFLPQHEHLLRSAKKHHGLKKDGKHSYEVFDYFEQEQFPPLGDVGAGHIDFTTGIVLEMIKNGVLYAPRIHPTQAHQFSFELSSFDPPLIHLQLEKAFALLTIHGESWQHFVQDALHFLFYARDFLRQNPDVPILIYSVKDQTVLELIKNELKLTNPIIQIAQSPAPAQAIKVKNLFLCRFTPESHLYSCAPVMRREVNRYFTQLDKKSGHQKNRLVYLSRSGLAMRSVRNEAAVCEMLKEYAKAQNLEWVYWDSGQYSLEQRLEHMRTAKLVVAPHGGAILHVYWLSPGTDYIEFVFPEALETVMSICCSIGLNYWLLPVAGAGHFTPEVDINLDELSEILKRVQHGSS